MAVEHAHCRWTCRRKFNDVLRKTGFIESDLTMNAENVWHDFAVATGLNHRYVHCMLRCFTQKKAQKHTRSSMTGWRLHLDENQEPPSFHAAIRRRGQHHSSIFFENVEDILLHVAKSRGLVSTTQYRFQPYTLWSWMTGTRNKTLECCK